MDDAETFFIGQIARIQRTIISEDVEKWKFLTWDFNVVYQSETWFELPHVPGIVCEGLIAEAMGKELTCHPAVILKKELVFLNPVHIGDMLTVEIETIDVNQEMDWVTEKVTCINQSGFEVVRGQVVLKILAKKMEE
ncbi:MULTISPECIES: hypothetical protein [Neobacillus]|uniref:Uncharacterized protein n=1 Tax=Neobacillus rhizophilus TaxID=2833579 RepID=A0A942YZU3_9BACI|nr:MULTISPECIES: hypothetical protein [Neobacillus]MBS4216511.1 hypothetical protein [Neobacillus rhizophilus]MBU8919813.1 hypothetical protein [Bacillus sp. FJAT-29953]